MSMVKGVRAGVMASILAGAALAAGVAQAQGVSFKEKEAELLKNNSHRSYVTPHDITNMAL